MSRAPRPLRLTACALLAPLAGAGAHAADRGVVQDRPGFRDALTAPLEDLNLKHTQVPDVLMRAQASPYEAAGLDHCEAVAAEIGRLDAVLGPDLAEPPPPDLHPPKNRTASQAHAVAVEVAQDRAHSLIPFRSWIRRLTGAEHNARELQAAISAGEVRRGYLKGVGMRMNCAPPAAPSWFVPKPKVEPVPTSVRPTEPPWARWWRELTDAVRRLSAWVAQAIRRL